MGIVRRLVRIVVVGLASLVLAVVAAVVVSQTAWFKDWLRGVIAREASRYVDGTVSIGRLRGNLLSGARLDDLAVNRHGKQVVAVGAVSVDYDALKLALGDLTIDRISLDRPTVMLQQNDGTWGLAGAGGERRQGGQAGPGGTFSIRDIEIRDGRLLVLQDRENGTPVGTSGVATPTSIDRLDARLSVSSEAGRYRVGIERVALHSHAPDLVLIRLSGTIAAGSGPLRLDAVHAETTGTSLSVSGTIGLEHGAPALDLQATSDRFDLSELAGFLPALRGIRLRPAFRVTAKGPLERLGLDFDVRSSAGDASGKMTAGLRGPDRSLAGDARVRAVDLAPVVKAESARSRLTGAVRFDLQFPSAPGAGPVAGTYSVQADEAIVAGYRAQRVEARGRVDAGNKVTVTAARGWAYGAAVSGSGTVQPGVRGAGGGVGVALDLRGQVSGLDLRNLPRHLDVPLLDSRLDLDYRLDGVGRALSGEARLRPSTMAGATLADGTTASFSTRGLLLEYAASGGVGGLDLQRMGRALGIASLSSARLKSVVNGRFHVEGRGTRVDDLVLDATAALNSSTIPGVRVPGMDAEAHIANRGLRLRASGEFADLDPAEIGGPSSMKGAVSGRIEGEARLRRLSGVSVDDVSASGVLTLARSVLSGLSIDRATIDGSLADSTARIRQLTLAGPSLTFSSSGTLALGPAGASDLQYRLDAQNLADLERTVGRRFGGAVTIEGHVTGNRSELGSDGSLTADHASGSGVEVNTATARYRVTVPDLDFAAARVQADLRAASLRLGGQEVETLQARTTFSRQKIDFDATAAASPEQAHAVGTLLFREGGQEVRLSEFALKTPGATWTLANGHQPLLSVAGGRTTLTDVHLASDNQVVDVEGTVDERNSNLRASLTGVDLARLDKRLVGDRSLRGILNATASLTGPRGAPDLSSQFEVASGAFQGFAYDSLAGKFGLAGGAVNLDFHLQQGPAAWLTARGTLPASLFRPAPAAGGVSGPAAEPLDLSVDSSPIDLGVLQGVTRDITHASGTLEAHVRVTGTAREPRLAGAISVANGAFTVAPTGVAYKGLNGRFDLQPDRVVADTMSLTDGRGHQLSVSGEAGMREGQIGALSLTVKAKGLEVLRNNLGRLSVDSDLRIGGTVQAPSVEGTLTLDTGSLNVDEIIDFASASAYPTTARPGSAVTGSVPQAAQSAPASRGTESAGTAASAPPSVAPRDGVTPPAQAGAGVSARRATSGPLDALTLRVRAHVPDALVVKGQDIRLRRSAAIGLGDLNATLGGDLQLNKDPARQTRVVGQVRTIRGTYTFQGRRFDIQRGGQIRFDGGIPVNPSLDIAATRVITGVEARVHIGGTATKPDLTLTSRPPLDEADVLSLIVFNQPANQLGEGQQVSLAQRAGALATGFAASKLADSIGRALNLDTFEIQTASDAAAGQSAEVTLGQQLGQRLYVKVTQGVGADPLSQFVVDYRLTDFLRLQTTMTQGGTATPTLLRRVERSGVDLIFFFSY
jgi:autotransporter translocation and assembly factor TamB